MTWSWEQGWVWNGQQWVWQYTWVSRTVGKTVTFGRDVVDAWGSAGTKVLNHETGHAMGLPDLYSFTVSTHPCAGGWDLMGKISGHSPDLLAWHKWKLGRLADSQVTCVTGAEYAQVTLTPVETSGGMKAIVVKTGADTAIVVEVRSTNGNNSGACDTGVLMYHVDRRVASGSGPINVIDADPASAYCGTELHQLHNAAFDATSGNEFYQSWSSTWIDVVSTANGNYTVQVGVMAILTPAVVARRTCGPRPRLRAARP